MKRCPTCDKTFDDKMKFCQTDGTLLVDDAPPVDPYKTVVGNQSDIASAIPPVDPFKTMVAIPPKVEEPKAADAVLEVPEEIDSLKTMVVSQEEMKQAIKASDATDVPPLDLPPPAPPVAAVPIIEPKAPTPADFSPPPPPPPVFDESSSSATDFGQISPPKTDLPKPVESQKFDSKSKPADFSTQSPYGNQENKPIPSPFDGSMIGYQPPTAPPFDAPKPPPVKEPESPFGGSGQESSNQSPFQASAPFGLPDSFNAPLQQNEWTPPPAPVSDWQNQELGANTPFQPPVAGGGQSQTLALTSLILGGIGIITIIPTLIFTFCGILPIGFGLAAIITGFLGRSRAKKKPDEYTGGGLALGGIITGAISFLVPIVIIAITLLLVFGMLSFSALR